MLNSSDFMELESKRLTLEEIIEALMQDHINLIEICGMRGIGKTTMVKEVVKRVKEENLFDEVCLLDVLGELNPGVIRQRVIDNFDKADMRKDRKILVVLDNIGVEFHVQLLRTPWGCSHRTFKILFTSKIQGIWRLYKKEIALGLLSDDDALKLFTFKADFLVYTPHLLPLATKIVNVCGGLPALLVTIREMVWDGRDWPTTEDSLEVMKCKLEDMLESLTSRITNPFPSMSLLHVETASSNYKEMDERARRLFLFCCLFEREKYIRVEDLARCALRLRFFRGEYDYSGYGNHLDEVREQVYTSVDYLKKKHFLWDGKDHEHVAVPAFERTIGIFVASSLQGCCLLRHGAVFELRDRKSYYSYISVISRKITQLPAGLIGNYRIKFLLLECSKLKSADLRQEQELEVLFLNYFNGTLMLPYSGNLHILSLQYCPGDVCKNISGLGKLGRLGILSFRGSGIKELPKEIGNLRFLQLLDLRETFALNHLPPNVISCLVRLEELYLMDSNFVDWEGVGEEEGRNANLKEFKDLHMLKTLQIYVRTDVLIPKLKVFSRFKIERVIS